jgi:hypothetical protein
MANLTAQLGDISTASAQIINQPGEGSGSTGTALKALASGLTSIAGAFEDQRTRKRQAAQDARQAANDAREAGERSAKDATTLAVNDVNIQMGAASNAPPPDPLGGIISGVVDTARQEAGNDADLMDNIGSTADRIKAYDTAVKQGTLSPIARRAMIDNQFNRIINEHPEWSPAIIAEQFEKLGAKSDLFRQYKQDVSAADAAVEAKQKDRDEGISIGRKMMPLGDVLQATDDELYAFGQKYRRDETILKALRDEAAEVRANKSATMAETTFTQGQQNDQQFEIGRQQVVSALAPTLQKWLQYTTGAPEAGSNASFETQFASLRPRMEAYTNTIINNAVNMVRDPQAAAALRTQLNDYVQSNFFKPMSERGPAFTSAVKSVGESLNLRADIAMPLTAQLRAGGIKIEEIPEVMNAVPQRVKALVAKEMGLFSSKNLEPDVGKVHMANVIAMLKGETPPDMSLAGAKQYITGAALTHVQTGARSVLTGQTDGQMWMNSARQIAIASTSVNKGASPQILSRAMSGFARAENVQVIDKLMNNNETSEEARTLAIGFRAGAGHLTGEIKDTVTALSRQDPANVVQWDARNGEYVINPRQGWKPTVLMSRGAQVQLDQNRPKPSAELQTLVRNMNEGIKFLAATAKWDDDAPKGSSRELRAFYGHDEPTADMRKQVQTKKAKGDVLSIGESLSKDLETIPTLVSNDTSYDGDNADIIGPEGTGKNPRSTAVGVGQFTEETWIKTLRNNAPELIEGKDKQGILAMRSNKELARKAVGWLRNENGKTLSANGIEPTRENTALAHFAGAKGATKLLKADPNAPVERVLGQAAVDANPHLRGKTAGETVAWARNFYRSRGGESAD